MGVSGSGKTTIGELLATRFGLPFFDADDFHSAANIEKMRNGVALNDQDRQPWLSGLAENIRLWRNSGGAVLACSALKESYRQLLTTNSQAYWVFLNGHPELILQRLQKRTDHYMSPGLLDSQFSVLEKPAYGIHADVSLPVDVIVEQIAVSIDKTNRSSEFGFIGLGVMGKSLALNLAEKGVAISVYNRHVAGFEEGIANSFVTVNKHHAAIQGFENLVDFVRSIKRPRKILLMIFAGAIDAQIAELADLMEPGDVLIDGGNSNYKQTAERAEALAKNQLFFIGAGVSGGEEGARKGPAIMPGGSSEAYSLCERYFNLMAARDKSGKPCSAYIGPEGSGHFVKMVHNGIEYAEMQLLAEVYSLLRNHLEITGTGIIEILKAWNLFEQGSYLLEITIDILQKKEGDELLLDKILDKAQQKGTGNWSVGAALEYGVPYSPLSEAVMARSLSAMKSERVKAAKLYPQGPKPANQNSADFINSLKNAYQAARIINHEIGFNLMQQASAQNGWQLNLSEIARIWTNGCIIRSSLMQELSETLKTSNSILMAPTVVEKMSGRQKDFRFIVAQGMQAGFALPVFSAALNHFLGFITANSTANLLQAQRDYFGAHTYQRKNDPEGSYFHTDWKPQG